MYGNNTERIVKLANGHMDEMRGNRGVIILRSYRLDSDLLVVPVFVIHPGRLLFAVTFTSSSTSWTSTVRVRELLNVSNCAAASVDTFRI